MKQNWFLIGDIHGQIAPIAYFYRENRERLALDDCENYLILLGDVGCNYSLVGERDENFKKDLSKFPFTYICLRGNHEARVTDVMRRFPKRWKTEEKYGGTVYVEKEYPAIVYLQDIPAIYEFAGYKTLAIPGAYSVDKEIRLARHWQWFENEQLSAEEQQYGRELIKNKLHLKALDQRKLLREELVGKEPSVDLVISHTCPIRFEPRDLFLLSIDQTKVDKTMERYLDEIEAKLDYRRWAWGHYHADRLYPWDGEKEKLMLFNEKVVDLRKFMEMNETDYWEDILA